ncbi:hypothetical protein B0H11DRAFT_2182588 [Mycena galericulata]|nr:hypothetical protein B0H11DRAFT_2182588 [Mycena galericulata]
MALHSDFAAETAMCIQQASHVSEVDKGILGRYYRWLTEAQKFHHASADSLIKEHLEYRESSELNEFMNECISERPLSHADLDSDQFDWKKLSSSVVFSTTFKMLHYFHYFIEEERTKPIEQIHKRDDVHLSMRRLQEKASVLVLDQVPGGSEKLAWMECECIGHIARPACHESRAIRGLEWAWVFNFHQMLVSLGLSETEAEDKVAQWLKSRVDNILARKGQDELDWYSGAVGVESLDENISEEKSAGELELKDPIHPNDFEDLEKLRSTRKHPIRWEFALVGLEKGAGIDVLIAAWFNAFQELRVDCGVKGAAEEEEEEIELMALMRAAQDLNAKFSKVFQKLHVNSRVQAAEEEKEEDKEYNE